MTSTIRTQKGEKLPPIQNIHMAIAKDGTWFYKDGPIKRLPLVKLFASVLRRFEDGSYWLVTPAERGQVEVEDAPFVVVELQNEGQGQEQIVKFRTNIDQWINLGPDNPLSIETETDGQPAPYIDLGKGLSARLNRSVFYHLVDLAVERKHKGQSEFGVWSLGTWFPLMSEMAS